MSRGSHLHVGAVAGFLVDGDDITTATGEDDRHLQVVEHRTAVGLLEQVSALTLLVNSSSSDCCAMSSVFARFASRSRDFHFGISSSARAGRDNDGDRTQATAATMTTIRRKLSFIGDSFSRRTAFAG